MTSTRKTKAPDKSRPGKGHAQSDFLDDSLSDKIGTHLRGMYDEVVNEPIPDDFMKLLSDADAS